MAQMTGTFCERKKAPRANFDKRSFRWIQRKGTGGSTWILIGCPRGKWSPTTESCRVGTRAYKILTRKRGKSRCAIGQRTVKK